MTLRNGLFGLGLAIVLVSVPQISLPGESGLITKPSKYSVQETIKRFEGAVTAKGWVVFTEVDHAAAAAKFGLELRPRTVVVFGNPKIGTPAMQKAPTCALLGSLVTELAKCPLNGLTHVGRHRESVAGIDIAPQVFGRIVREPNLALIVLPHQSFRRDIDG